MGQKTAATTPQTFSLALPEQQNLFAPPIAALRAPIRPAMSSARMTRPVVMSASHGLNKNDKKFIREMNGKLLENGQGENLKREDVANPSFRHALNNSAGHRQLSKYQFDQIVEMSQKK
jgi:hypothetical protein